MTLLSSVEGPRREADMKQWELRGVTLDAGGQDGGPALVLEAASSLRTLVDQFPAVFWTTDAQLRFTSLLGGGLSTLGLGPNQIVGTTLFEFFETEDPRFPPIDAHKRALLGAIVEFEMEWAGRSWYSHVAPLHDSRGLRIGTICVALGTGSESTERTHRHSVLTSAG
jgi:PAS domain-containing protein